ncbi:MAG: LEA type 2 family protein [Methylococcaceae bacterium]
MQRLLLVLITVSLTACTSMQALGQRQLEGLQEPRITVKSIKPGPVRLTEQKFIVNLAIENPNEQGISAHEIVLALAINGKEIAKGINTKPVEIKSKATSQVEVAVLANTMELLQQGLLIGNGQQKTIPYQISGYIGLMSGVMQWLKLPVEYSGQIKPDDLIKRF